MESLLTEVEKSAQDQIKHWSKSVGHWAALYQMNAERGNHSAALTCLQQLRTSADDVLRAAHEVELVYTMHRRMREATPVTA